jgi:hypothetical protein
MNRKMAILLIAALLLVSAVPPAFAVGTKVSELRLQATKTFVSNSIDSAINVLDDTANGVERSALKDGQKAELKSRIEANVTWFEAKKADVGASTNVAGVLANAREANDRWNSVYPGLKKEIGIMSCDDVDELIAAGRNASAIVSGRIELLKAQGKDTNALEKTLADYNGHIDAAARHAANARSEVNAIGARLDGHYAAGFRQLTLAGNELKGSYADLKTIYRLFYGNSVKVS